MHLHFGDCIFDRSARTLTRDGQPVEITPKAFELLSTLLANRPRALSKAELHDRLWPKTFVSDTSLARLVSELRKVIGDEARDPRLVRTVHGYGYSFCGEAVDLSAGPRPIPGDEGSGGVPATPMDLTAPEAGPPPSSVAVLPDAMRAQDDDLAVRSNHGDRTGMRRWVAAGALVTLIGFLAIASTTLFDRERGPSLPGGTGQPSDRVRSIAVLPLVDLTGKPEEEYFAVGLTEALITQLAKLGELRVISRTSAMRYRNTLRSRSEIARELDVEAVLEGTVLHVGNRVRVTAELIRAQTDERVWVGEYEREMGDILRLQAEIARAVAAAVQLRLPPHEESLTATATTVDSEAYRSYLHGRFRWNRRTIADLEESIGHFRRAIELDPGFAAAHSGLADAYILLSSYYGLPPDAAFPLARRAAVRALAIDPMLAEAYASLGAVHLALDWNFEAAGEAYRRAIELGPGYATAHQWYAELLSVVGRHDEAVAEGRLAWHLDPLSPIVNAALGQRLNAAGRWEEALEQFADTLELEPRFAWIHREMAYAYTNIGSIDLALVERRQEMAIREIDEAWLAELQPVVARADLRGFWRWELRRLGRKAENGYVPALLFAEAREGIGDREQALENLERALVERGEHILQLSTSPELMSLALDPRACPSLTGVGLAHLCEPR